MTSLPRLTYYISGLCNEIRRLIVDGALLRYRVMAWTVGVMLILVTAATVIKYAADNESFIQFVGPIHGFLYVIYLVTALDLATRLRWSVVKALGVCLAGTIPFVSFVVERQITNQVRRRPAVTRPGAPGV